jgi:hypothetical protein
VNDLGVLLLQAIAQSTAFLLLGIALYGLARRLGPAFGASAALGSLVVMAGVAVLTFSPWPRWRLPDLATAPVPRGEPAVRVPTKPEPSRDEKSSVEPATVKVAKDPSEDNSNIAFSWLESIRPADVLTPAAPPEHRGWKWPAWFAWLILAIFGVGLARLAAGLWGMRALRSSGSRIDDPGLIDLVEVLRAEMSCRRPVELRESDGLAAPATVGWRRPVVLLPDDWRGWDESERRAVLAHELAHVCRNDFLAGLLAQLSLTVHFYHPLAHWLASRFRLEQELAADAWGSGLSGGKASYLMTLARLALERDRRASSWPVRAFLPSRGTFVRRIEMLRDAKTIRHVPITWRFRALAFGTLAGLGVLVAGLRPPIGESRVLAQAPEVKKEAPANKPFDLKDGPAEVRFDLAFPTNRPFNLKYVPAEANAILAIKPAELLAYPEFKELLAKARDTEPFKNYLIVPPEEIGQLVAFGEFRSSKNTTGVIPMFSYGLVLRTNRPQEWPIVLGRIINQAESVIYEGKTYTRWKNFSHEPSGYAPDEKTLILADQETIRQIIEDRDAPSPRHDWDEVWPKVEKSQVALAMEMRWVRRALADYRMSKPGGNQLPFGFSFETVSPLFEKTRGYAAGFNLSPGFSVDVEAACGTESKAKSVAETVQALVTLGRNFERSMDRDLPSAPKHQREDMRWLLTTIGPILNHARITTEGRTASIQSKAALDLSHWVNHLAHEMEQSQNSRMRRDSVIHLKKIGLAFHNYHDVHKHFPPPVLHGGKSGKVPYSWRVAILPFLEGKEKELYDQYNFDEPWDGPSNRKLIDKMPAIYSYPLIDGSPSSTTNASYFVMTGPHTATSAVVRNSPFMSDSPFPEIVAITDGTSNTILAVEAKRDIPWTKPEDLPLDEGPVQPTSLGGYWPNGFNALFCDGAVKSLKNSIDPTVLRALFTRDGGEVISRDAY